MKLPYSSAFVPVILALLAVNASAASVTSVVVSKPAENVQTDATTQALTANGWGFGVTVVGTSLSAPTVTFPGGTSNATMNPSQHNGGVLGFNAGNGDWEYGSPSFDNIGTSTSTDRNTRFPNGNYSVAIPTFTTVTLNLSNPANLNTIPLFTVTGGSWSGGKYVVDVSQTVTITSNAFTNFSVLTGNHVDSALRYGLFGPSGSLISGTEYYYSANNAASNIMSQTITPNTLTSGNEYVFFGANVAVVDKITANSALNIATFESSNSFTISAIPEPSTYAAFAGLGALGLACWRRRRSQAQN